MAVSAALESLQITMAKGVTGIALMYIYIDIGRFYIALLSSLEQTPCTLAACDSERVTRVL